MTFLAPLWLAVAASAAAAVIALHFFARQRPRPAVLPTARFVPDLAARAPSAARRPSDLLVLLLRVLALLLLGVALAGPVPAPARRAVARVVVVAPSRAMRSPRAALDSARAYATAGDTVISDSALLLARSPVSGLRSPLSTALVRALRASAALRDRADSIELVLVSSLTEDDIDAATDSIRRLWPGRARLIRVAGREPAVPRRIEVAGMSDDPLRLVVALLGGRSGAPTRIVRGAVTAADSAMARGGAVLVEWPRDPSARWPAAHPDTIGGVNSGSALVVAPFVRAASLSGPGDAVAHWVDGAVAADEQAVGSGCVRRVAIALPETGDLVLRRSVGRLVDELAAPCGGAVNAAPLPDERLAGLRAEGPLMVARSAPALAGHASSASGWLVALAALFLAAEMFARARKPAA